MTAAMTAAINRRSLLRSTAFGAAALASASWAGRAGAAEDLVVGIVYVGPRGDFGWNQSHATAVEALRKVPGVTVVEEENVPETLAVSNTMRSMMELDGAKLIFGTSFGYFNPFMVDLAKQYPDVQFRHPTTLWSADKHPANLGGYFAYLDQAHYVDGVAAGLSSSTGKIGYIAAKPISLVLRNINECDGQAHLHRRLVAAGARGGGGERARRRGMRCRRLPCRQPEGDRRDAGAGRGEELRP